MKITNVETLFCDAGWRPWIFIKISTDDGLTGISECTDSHGSPLGIEGVINTLKQRLMGQDPRKVEKLYWDMASLTRQSPGSIIQKAIGGIENALLDIKARALGVSVCELLGGPIREKITVYWSHCGTTRARSWEITGVPALDSYEAVGELIKEVKRKGFSVIKTNMIVPGEKPYVHMPGFAKGYGTPELNYDREFLKKLEKYIAVLREAGGDDLEIILDMNFNFKTEGFIQVARMLEPYRLFWVEIDSYDAAALRFIRQSVKTPVCSGENLYTVRGFRPFFEHYSMDVASIDIPWNGFLQSKKIADMAELYEMNVSTHNYYSHVATFISAQFCALIPNFKICEVDVDDVPWKDAIVTKVPKIEEGQLFLTQEPGWGVELNEEVIREHPWPQ